MTKINQSFINPLDLQSQLEAWRSSLPFNHLIIDNFLTEGVAKEIVNEFPEFESDVWKIYNNAIEIKKLVNHWDKFGKYTYQLFSYLNSREFIDKLEILVGEALYADIGLNGGGLHSHKSGGKLNTHLDYSIHPKLELERRLNLLIYVTPNWNDEWGGRLGLWSHKQEENKPDQLIKSIEPQFNRAVIFDTTQNSWHGLPEPINCPAGICRNSIAVYYLCEPRTKAANRGKALFAPSKDQEGDEEILKLIQKRATIDGSKSVYGDN